MSTGSVCNKISVYGFQLSGFTLDIANSFLTIPFYNCAKVFIWSVILWRPFILGIAVSGRNLSELTEDDRTVAPKLNDVPLKINIGAMLQRIVDYVSIVYVLFVDIEWNNKGTIRLRLKKYYTPRSKQM